MILARLAIAALCAAAAAVDPLDLPARPSPLVTHRPLNGVAAAGGRLVAVGQRGHAAWSDDGGRTWTQAPVPVRSDLTAVRFASADRGWAVGHDGVVLATADGGRSWAKQLDGRGLGLPLSETSLLDVWFDDEQAGWAVGAFGLVVRTADGGRTWTRWAEPSDDRRGLHLYAIRRVAGDLYAAGEQGLVLKLDPGARRFRRLAVGYGGSLFGIVGQGGAVVVFGLRGSALRSEDRGASWRRLETGVEAALTAGTELPGGRIALASQAGQVLLGAGGGGPLRLARPGPAPPVSAIAPAGPGALVLVGAAGARVEPLP
jgi:photosystem II stability/assembly factor-like uncharacterized protein